MHPLHPRSASTSTLFTTTLAVSFLVVGLPHLLPCPVDRRQFADSDGKVRRRKKQNVDGDGTVVEQSELDENGRPKRECPVPKPGGLVGQIMGFEQKEKEGPVEVVVRSLRSKEDTQSGDGSQSEKT